MQQDEQLISFKVAMLAKEKGFDYKTFYCFLPDSTIQFSSGEDGDNDKYNHNEWDNYSAPTQGLLQKWLRELPTPIVITPTTDFIAWEVQIQHADKDLITLSKNNDNEWFISYEEALEAGLFKALKLIK